jgi:hypothetical protein
MTEIPTPDSRPAGPWKQRAQGAGIGAAVTLAFTLPFHDSGTVLSATCPSERGVTIVTPDQVAQQQGKWLGYQGEICIQGITHVITDTHEKQIVEVVNPDNGSLESETVYPETLVGQDHEISVYTKSILGPSTAGDALLGLPYIGGPPSVTEPNLLVVGRIQPSRQG